MKVIIAGSRDITDYNLVNQTVKESGFIITEVVSGGARGVDKLGEKYAIENNLILTIFNPNWSKEGLSAGFNRNKKMAEYADALIAIWNGSSGTANMIEEAKKKNLQIFIKRV